MTEQKLLMQLDDYLKAGIHIGTRFRTKFMSKFIYKIKPDGLSVLNVEQINIRLILAANLLSQYEPKDILVVSRRENGWKPVKLFSKVTGIKNFTGRYPPGILTNVQLEDFVETKLILVIDPIPDKNVIKDAEKLSIPVMALCDTNNEQTSIDLVIPCNNKGKKSLALILYVLAREYAKSKGIIKSDKDFKYTVDDFTSE
ncbi:MAG: 30S ribosomal protein S2 [Candidatus Woesearchaeota archaeon]